jgi:hypothetical protein
MDKIKFRQILLIKLKEKFIQIFRFHGYFTS